MELRFSFTRQDEWPCLAWLAHFVESDPIVNIKHGPQVETGDDWYCEAVWDGRFESGDFDRTDLVFGSGARLRHGQVTFVSSGSTVDRLQFLELDGKTWVSNSLVCLLAETGVKVDVTYDRFPEFFRSIVKGIDNYERRLATRSGRCELIYFRNLIWDGHKLIEDDKPFPRRDFSTFDKYHNFLRTSIEQIAVNMRAPARRHRYEMIAGLSSGYDSTTVAVLAREHGLKDVFSFHAARGGHADHGREVAKVLGLDLTMVDRRGWQQHDSAEIAYFSATGLGADVVFSSAKDLLTGRVLVSGFHGDKIWAKDTSALGPDIVRGDASGLSFTEHRLILGTLHFAVPFAGVRQIKDICALSNHIDLTAWDVPGDYSRPISRRIVEEAGVPQDTVWYH